MKGEARRNSSLKSCVLSPQPCQGHKCTACLWLVVAKASFLSLTDISLRGWFPRALRFLKNIFWWVFKGECRTDRLAQVVELANNGVLSRHQGLRKEGTARRERTKRGPGKQTQPSAQERKMVPGVRGSRCPRHSRERVHTF